MTGTAAVVVDGVLVASSVVALWLGARWFVRAAVALARRFGVSELVIGLTVVAIGTSAPEFVVTVDAAVAGASDIAVGNVVGSNVFNLGFVLGAVALSAWSSDCCGPGGDCHESRVSSSSCSR